MDYLKPFLLGDTIEAFVRTSRIGRSSMTQRFELCHAETGALHTVIDMVIVNLYAFQKPAAQPGVHVLQLRAFAADNRLLGEAVHEFAG